MRARITTCFAVAATLASAPAAVAAPDRQGTVTPAASFAWSGDATTAVGLVGVPADDAAGFCSKGPTNYCDVTLLQTTARGNLQIDMPEAGDGQTHDFDLAVYRSTAAGIASIPLGTSAAPGGPESVLVEDAPAGYYVAFIIYTVSAGLEAPSATATLMPPTTPEPEPPAPAAPVEPPKPTVDAAPTSRISGLARSMRARSFRRLSGTAADDVAIAEVHVAITRARGSRCYSLNTRGRWTRSIRRSGRCIPRVFLLAEGAERWSLRIRRPLPRGAYVVHSRAVDNAEQAEPLFGPANSRVLRLR